MRLYLSIFGHANKASLPLRFGVSLTEKRQQFCELANAIFDEEGTSQQRAAEIEKGRKHYSGELIIRKPDDSSNFDPMPCRVVVESPNSADQAPRVVTILTMGDVKGDLTVTRHIEGMLKRNQIQPSDLIEVFHPAYRNGNLKDSNDCEELWREHICSKEQPVEVVDQGNRKVQESLISDSSNFREAMSVDDIDEVDVKAPLTYVEMVIPGVQNTYVMADAFIESVEKSQNGSKILLTFINSKGLQQTIESFPLNQKLMHLAPLHNYAFNYLMERQQQRAKFAICMSPSYRGTFAESVTAIALQISRRGLA